MNTFAELQKSGTLISEALNRVNWKLDGPSFEAVYWNLNSGLRKSHKLEF